MKKGSEKSGYVTILVLIILQLLFLYIIKYINQELAVSEFSLANIGNLFNLFVYAGLLSGIFILYKKQKSTILVKTILVFIVIDWLILVSAFLSTKIEILSNSAYFLNLSGNKLVNGFLYILYLFILIYFLIRIWSSVFFKVKISTFRIIVNTAIAFLIFMAIILVYTDNAGYASGRWSLSKSKENVAVVLGAAVWSGNIPSPTLSSRVDKAIELLQKGFASKIIFTGGSAPGEMTEAEVAFEYAKAKGIDTNLVESETLTASTTEQIRWIKNNLINDK